MQLVFVKSRAKNHYQTHFAFSEKGFNFVGMIDIAFDDKILAGGEFVDDALRGHIPRGIKKCHTGIFYFGSHHKAKQNEHHHG